MEKSRCLVFDLAGVLFDFGGVDSLRRLSAGRVTEDEFSRFWSRSQWADRLYRGQCAPEAFASGAVQEFALDVTPAEFLVEFQTWLRGPYPGALELVRSVRAHHRLACLSNTNALDVRPFRTRSRSSTTAPSASLALARRVFGHISVPGPTSLLPRFGVLRSLAAERAPGVLLAFGASVGIR